MYYSNELNKKCWFHIILFILILTKVWYPNQSIHTYIVTIFSWVSISWKNLRRFEQNRNHNRMAKFKNSHYMLVFIKINYPKKLLVTPLETFKVNYQHKQRQCSSFKPSPACYNSSYRTILLQPILLSFSH